MQRAPVASTLLALLLPVVLAMPTRADEASTEIRRLFDRYIDAWNKGDLAAIAHEIYRPPVYVFEAAGTQPLSTPQAIVDLLSPLRAELDRSGFSRSVIRDVSICDLGGGLAFASLHFDRFDRNGSAMDEVSLASAYILRGYEDGWHLVAHVMQAQPRALGCSN